MSSSHPTQPPPPFATLYTSTTVTNARTLKILAAANFNNLHLSTDPTFLYPETNRTPAWQAKFPHGKIPALETPRGFCISEASAIAHFVAESGPAKGQLLGRTVKDRALVHMWGSFADGEVFPNAIDILRSQTGPLGSVPEAIVRDREGEFLRALRRLEGHLGLEGRVWLVRGDEVSLADLSVASSLYWALRFFMDEEYRRGFPAIMGWWERLMAVEEVGKAFGAPVELCVEKRGFVVG